MQYWAPYVPVAKRRANALRRMKALRSKGKTIEPIEIQGRTIARTFWGRGWCDHLESFSDFANRLPRGRTYVRNGSVCHLAVHRKRIEAIVSGSELYKVNISIKKLKPATWMSVKQECSGRIGSMLELLQGKLSDHVMSVVTDRAKGLFPRQGEVELHCSCPDWATMCKHVAAALYGVGNRLDDYPELLFKLRDVDAEELITSELTMPGTTETSSDIDLDQLGEIFGIDLDVPKKLPRAPRRPPVKRHKRNGRTTASKPMKPARKEQSDTIKDRLGGSESGKRPDTARTTSRRKKRNRAISTELPLSGTPRIRPSGKSMARLRKRLGLSVADLAQQLNVSTSSVYRWEATPGRLKLKSKTRAALADLHASE